MKRARPEEVFSLLFTKGKKSTEENIIYCTLEKRPSEGLLYIIAIRID